MHFRSTLKMFVAIATVATITLSFQNCAPVNFSELENASLGSETPAPQDPEPQNPDPLLCHFNGQTYSEGQTVEAFLASSVPLGQTCTSEIRLCRSGSFTGSYAFASCEVAGPAACLFNGKTIASGQTVSAYQNSSVPFGASCVSENRTCTNGVLSGSYNFETCAVGAPASCLFNGQTVAHGAQVTAYVTSTVAYGGVCQSEIRSCNNGVLSGSATFASCSAAAPASCLFNGQTVPHAGTIKAYQSSSVAYGQTCAGQDRVCNNGVLSGSYTFASCTVGAPASCLFNGQTVAHGQAVTAYQRANVAYGQTCVSQSRVCSNGTLSGTYTAPSCTVPACVANQGQACERSTRYYWESARFDSLDACDMYKGNLGFQAPCPATSAGYEWSGKTCRTDSAPTNGKWMARLLCAESVMGTVSCAGACE